MRACVRACHSYLAGSLEVHVWTPPAFWEEGALRLLAAASESLLEKRAAGYWEACRQQEGNLPLHQERSLICVTSVAVVSTG